jgi:hypothetical protein
MERQELLEVLAHEIADRNHAYQHSLEIIQTAKPARKVHRYHGYGFAFTLVITGTIYGIADAEAANLSCQAADFVCMGLDFIFSPQVCSSCKAPRGFV